jgi:hypothetical protein
VHGASAVTESPCRNFSLAARDASDIGEDLADEGERPLRGLQERACAVTVLKTGWMWKQHQCPAIRIDERVALGPLIFLPAS